MRGSKRPIARMSGRHTIRPIAARQRGHRGSTAPGGPATLDSVRTRAPRAWPRRTVREPAGLVELGLACASCEAFSSSMRASICCPLALTRLGLLLAQRGEPRLELGVRPRRAPCWMRSRSGLQLALLRVDRLLQLRLGLARGFAGVRPSSCVELRSAASVSRISCVVDDLAREAAERRPAQRPEAGVDRRHPGLVDVGDDGGLAGGQRGRRPRRRSRCSRRP